MPAPYLPADPASTGERPPFELVIDGASAPYATTDMALTLDDPDNANAPTLNTWGTIYAGSLTVAASQTGTLGGLLRMNRATGAVDKVYDLSGVTLRDSTGTAVTSVTSGQEYLVTVNVPA